MKKKFAAIAVILTASFCTTPVFADSQEAFLADMSAGLTERWANDQDTNTMTSAQLAEYFAQAVATEYDKLSKYDSETFDNEKFDSMVHAYIDALETQQAAINYMSTLPDVENILWTAGYNTRAILIPDFIDYYGLTIENSASNIQEMRDAKASLSEYTVVASTNASNTTGSTDTTTTPIEANMGDTAEQEPIEIYNDDGVKVTITKYEKNRIWKC